MKIPYGRSNFGEIRRRGFFYVDKTPFLPALERDESGYAYLLFHRPRRMGKSLIVSLLEHYYDLARAEEFDALFRGLWIHEHPTPERNRYLVLSLDFSTVTADGGQDSLRRSFLEGLKGRVRTFLMRYRERIPALGDFHDSLSEYHESSDLMVNLLGIIAATGDQLYVIIDEYDHFANSLLSAGSEDLYTSLVERTGFVRAFYAALKTGTTSGAVWRIFITGVSPLLLDDLSSGFNIVTNISDSHRFNALAGFTCADVERALDELLASREQLAASPELVDRARLLDVLTQYYNGYRFSPDSSERVFNSDMVLYFLRELDARGRFPDTMLDFNVRTEYRSLQRIGMLTGAASVQRRALLEEILVEGGIRSGLSHRFGAKSLSSRQQFISLLYYMGMLTLGEPSPDELPGTSAFNLVIPNQVIRELQWEHLRALLNEQAAVVMDRTELEDALSAMAAQGDIEPFLALFHERVVKALGLKDLRRLDEKALKLMMLALISLSRLFPPAQREGIRPGLLGSVPGGVAAVPGRDVRMAARAEVPARGGRRPRSRGPSRRRRSRYRGPCRCSRGGRGSGRGRWCSWARGRCCSGRGRLGRRRRSGNDSAGERAAPIGAVFLTSPPLFSSDLPSSM